MIQIWILIYDVRGREREYDSKPLERGGSWRTRCAFRHRETETDREHDLVSEKEQERGRERVREQAFEG